MEKYQLPSGSHPAMIQDWYVSINQIHPPKHHGTTDIDHKLSAIIVARRRHPAAHRSMRWKEGPYKQSPTWESK